MPGRRPASWVVTLRPLWPPEDLLLRAPRVQRPRSGMWRSLSQQWVGVLSRQGIMLIDAPPPVPIHMLSGLPRLARPT